MIDIELLTAQLSQNSPASAEDICAFVARAKVGFPPGYIEFMQRSDGAEGPIGRKGRYLVLWPVASIISLNEQHHIDEFAPHLLAFGSDGGGEAFAFDRRTEPARIVRVPFVGLDDEICYGTRFDEFLARLSEE
ncbi:MULTISPECIES: SMI1/KNR4 family protein [Sorangium]|uniref:SMI1/KNR4 family protein n=1 Tax=Sorangium TaxID=39643 RepID=UPI00101A9643|nr:MULTISPECIES: SMI1/KNR4 family protein [Sorangium]